MSTIKEENRFRIELAYILTKFGLKYKAKDKKVTEVFADVATELGYSDGPQVANIYYEKRKTDAEPRGEQSMRHGRMPMPESQTH